MKAKHRYRIVTDKYSGFEAQVKFWWFPFLWFQMHEPEFVSNTWLNVEDAEEYIRNGSPRTRTVVKEVFLDA